MSEARQRERYEPPAVCRVRFAAGEVAQTACKSKPVGGGPDKDKCKRAGGGTRVERIGS